MRCLWQCQQQSPLVQPNKHKNVIKMLSTAYYCYVFQSDKGWLTVQYKKVHNKEID